MNKIARTATAVMIASSGLLFAGQAANAMPCDLPGAGCTGDSNTGYPGGVAPTPDPGKGHEPVTFCHNGHLITTDNDGELNGHKTRNGEHADDVFREDLGRDVTAADCPVPAEVVKPVKPAPLYTNPVSKSEIFCDVPQPYRTHYLAYDVTDYVYDATTNTWVLGETGTVSGTTTYNLDPQSISELCPTAPVVPPTTPGTGEVAPTQPVVPATPDVPSAPEAGVEPAVATVETVPATEAAAPLANTGAEQASDTKPDQLAYTGGNDSTPFWALAGAGLLALGAVLVRKTRKA